MLRLFLIVISMAISSNGFSQESVKLVTLKKEMTSGMRIKVINFWATWCAPCVKELPLFEKLQAENKDVEVLLVSMDYDLDPNPEKVKKFMDRKKLQARVMILAEENPTAWIDQIDKNWSGAIPATLVVNPVSGKRKFTEGELKEGEVEKIIQTIK
jgi:thiol-disulfide isomerase/thioredoxin